MILFYCMEGKEWKSLLEYEVYVFSNCVLCDFTCFFFFFCSGHILEIKVMSVIAKLIALHIPHCIEPNIIYPCILYFK